MAHGWPEFQKNTKGFLQGTCYSFKICERVIMRGSPKGAHTKELQQSNTVYSVKFAQIIACASPKNPSGRNSGIYSQIQPRNIVFGSGSTQLKRESRRFEASKELYTEIN